MPDRAERRWLIVVAVTILGLTSIPYLLGYFQQGTNWHFTGFLFGVEDGNSYIAKMLSGSVGNWLFRSPYSTMPQTGVLAFFPYMLLGKLAYPPELHDQLVVLFQFFRLVGGILLIWATYSFCSLFITDLRQRKIATVVILVGGGFGWLGWMFVPDDGSWRLPLEVYSPEAFGFLSILGLPHLAAARAFLLFGFIHFLKQNGDGSWLHSAIIGGLCWLVVGFFQPLTIVVGYSILGCYLLLIWIFAQENRWKAVLPLLKKAAVIGAIASPWVIYNFLFFGSDSYLKAWYTQNIISSPPIADYFWSFGLYMAASIPAFIYLFKQRDRRAMILPAWVLCAAILAYFPYNLQRRFIDGIWIALVLLVFISLSILQTKKWKAVYRVIIGTTFIAPVLVMMVVSQGVMKTVAPVYREAAEIRMFTAIKDMAKPGDTILCSYETGNVIPAWAPVFVMAGHGPESANLKEILPEVKRFYSGEMGSLEQTDFIQNNGIDFIIFGPSENAYGNWISRPEGMITIKYDKDGYQVYQVVIENAG